MKALKIVYQAVGIFALGALGGMTWQAIVLPYMAQSVTFKDLWFVEEFKDGETVIFPKEEIVIQENVVLVNAVEKVEKVMVGVRTELAGTKKGKTLEGAGLILTSDGLVVTLAELIPQDSAFSFYINGEKVNFEVLKRDSSKNLALVRVEQRNLPTRDFVDLSKIKLGQRVFLTGVIFVEAKPQKIVDEGIIKYISQDFVMTNIFEKETVKGSILFDIEGNILGINSINPEGIVVSIPNSIIRQFAGF